MKKYEKSSFAWINLKIHIFRSTTNKEEMNEEDGVGGGKLIAKFPQISLREIKSFRKFHFQE